MRRKKGLSPYQRLKMEMAIATKAGWRPSPKLRKKIREELKKRRR